MPNRQRPKPASAPQHRTGKIREQEFYPDLNDHKHIPFYATIIDSLLSGVWVTDRDDRIFFTNRAMETISGLPSEKIIGAHLFNSFDAETVQGIVPYYQLAKNTLEPVYYDAVPVVTPVGRSSYQSGMLVPQIRDGRFDGMIATIEDVTRRVVLEQEQRRAFQNLENLVDLRTAELQAINTQLHLSRENLERVIEGSLDAIVVSDIRGLVSMVNQAYCDMHLVNREKILGRHIAEILFASPGTYETTLGDTITIDDEMVRAQYAHLENTLFATGRCTGLKIFDCRADGLLFPAEVNTSLFFDDQQEMTGATTIIRDTTERFLFEKQLIDSQRDLEQRVHDRTAELELARQRLEESNTALKVLLAKRDQDQKILEHYVLENLRNLVDPCIAKLRQACTGRQTQSLLDILTNNLQELTSPFAATMRTGFGHLSATETRVAGLIRDGKSSSEIADALGISIATIQFHRKNIRKKLGLQNSKKNLFSYLKCIN